MRKFLNKADLLRKSPYLTTLFRYILGIIFLYASLDKIYDPGSFAAAIQNYQLIPMSLTHLIAIILPWLEFYCGILLLLGWQHQSAAYWLAILNSFFLIALISASWRGLDIDCGCFGSGSKINLTRIVEDLFLLAFSLHILYFPHSAFALENRRLKNPD